MKPHLFTIAIALLLATSASAQVTREEVAGVTNFARLKTTVACAGATKPEALSGIKQMGFVSVINLRQASEQGANVEAEGEAAKAAGLQYVHLPFNSSSPDAAVVDQFLKAITEPGREPAFIHCAGGGRAATMWLVKRVLVDKWELDPAVEEATALGLTNPKLKQFALDYIAAHRK
ncbi:MAG: sulfur transferase domain-containing protein [Candidatus Korobacteraceae bacterium]